MLPKMWALALCVLYMFALFRVLKCTCSTLERNTRLDRVNYFMEVLMIITTVNLAEGKRRLHYDLSWDSMLCQAGLACIYSHIFVSYSHDVKTFSAAPKLRQFTWTKNSKEKCVPSLFCLFVFRWSSPFCRTVRRNRTNNIWQYCKDATHQRVKCMQYIHA